MTMTAIGDDDMSATSTRGFWVANRSSERLTFLGVEGIAGQPVLDEDSWPAVNGVLEPGQTMRFEVTSSVRHGHGIIALFGGTSSDASVKVELTVAGFERYSTATSNFGPVQGGGEAIVISDKPGTKVVPASDPIAQAAVLDFCAEAGAMCSFKPTAQVQASSARHPVSSIAKMINGSADPVTRELLIRETATVSDSITINPKVKVSIMKIVELSTTTSYGRTWTSSHKFTDSQTVTVQPNHASWVESALPVLRTTGNFTVTLGANTWILQGVSFDTPDPPFTFEVVTEKLSPSQAATAQGEVDLPSEIVGSNSL